MSPPQGQSATDPAGFLARNLDERSVIRIGCGRELSDVLAEEVESLGFTVKDRDRAGVEIAGSLRDAMRLMFELRTAGSIAYLLKHFRCPSTKALARHIESYPWENVIAPDGYLTVTSFVRHPSVNNSMYPNLLVKDAIVDRMTKREGRRPDSGPTRQGVVVHVHWVGDRCRVFLDLAGRRLADRGYRKRPHAAPVQETLAASILRIAGYDGTKPFVDPMCGSGTFAIEAALIAAGRPPGLLRHAFAIQSLRGFDDDAIRSLRAELKKSARAPAGEPPRIVAGDIDPAAVEAARANAMTAGVEQLIRFKTGDFEDVPLPAEPGVMVMNPEYGLRLGDEEQLLATYQRIGDFLKQRCPGWRAFILTGNLALGKRIGLRPSRRIPIWNADVECRLLAFDLWTGAGDG